MNPELTSQQHELKGILMKFDSVFSDVPGQTNIVEHDLTIEHEQPIRQKPYSIPKMK